MGALMQSAQETLDLLNGKLEGYRQALAEKHWKQHSSEAMPRVLQQAIDSLQEVRSLVLELSASSELEEKSEAQKHSTELQQTIELLKRNLSLEKGKSMQKESDLQQPSELLDSLEQKVLSSLLKTRYFAERTQLQLKAMQRLSGESSAKNVLQLLNEREQELSELKKKYAKLRTQTLVARMSEETTPDLEQELSELTRKLEKESHELEKTYSSNSRQLEKIIQSQAELEQKVRQVNEILSRFLSKSLETNTALKKERDYAKRVLLEMEHDVMHLRSAYSRQLLGLEEHKTSVEKGYSEKFDKNLSSLRRQLSEKEELVRHFRSLLEEKAKRLSESEEKSTRLQLLLKQKQKHDFLKTRFDSAAKKTAKKKKGK